jgi:NitT/TauT family transport system substrate-binding protein
MGLLITRARATALLFGGAALYSNASRVRAQALSTIRVAALPIESAAEVFYGKDMGFFANAGLDVDIQSLKASGANAAAIASGALDIGYAAIDTLATIHQKGIPVVVIAPANEYLSPGSIRTTALVVPESSPVRTAKDLEGKTLAVGALDSIAEIAPRVWIDQHGGSSSLVKMAEIPFSAMPAALDAGRVDAIWIAEPFIGVAMKNGRALTYGFDGISKHFLVSAWFTTPQWAKDHPDLVSRFVAVMHETAVWANKNPQMSGEILARYTKVDPAVIANMARAHYGERLSASLTQPLIDISTKYNGLTTFPAQELIYTIPGH